MPQFRKILVPVDFSECSREAFRYALSLARQYKSKVILLHVIDSRSYDSIFHIHMVSEEKATEMLKQHCLKKYEQLLADHPTEGIEVEQRVKSGHPYVEIVCEAAHEEVDLIVIGTHGRSGLDHILFGSVAEKVVRKAPCPTLAVKLRGHKFRMPGTTHHSHRTDVEET